MNIHLMINIFSRLLNPCVRTFKSTPFLGGVYCCVVAERLGHVVTSWEKI